MNMNDLLTITHTGDEYEKYLGAVVPPIFMNSLHVFPDFESYLNFDDYKEDSFIYGRESNPTAHIMERNMQCLLRLLRLCQPVVTSIKSVLHSRNTSNV